MSFSIHTALSSKELFFSFLIYTFHLSQYQIDTQAIPIEKRFWPAMIAHFYFLDISNFQKDFRGPKIFVPLPAPHLSYYARAKNSEWKTYGVCGGGGLCEPEALKVKPEVTNINKELEKEFKF